MAQASGGIMQAMSALEVTQQSSSHMLAVLLGNARTWGDLLFYGTGAMLVVMLAWHPATAQARLPICIALAACLMMERAFVTAATRWQWVRNSDARCMPLTACMPLSIHNKLVALAARIMPAQMQRPAES
jgi:hypothetical protein